MFYFHYEYQKKNTFRVHMLRLILVFFRSITKKSISKIILPYQTKSCFDLELNWIQKYKPEKIASKRRKEVEAYIIDETIIKVGSNHIWLWIAIEPTTKEILGISISLE